jgi:anionic cell wall polymer biosynthesis LytR-Cps2A-Psr (LCP) family protein
MGINIADLRMQAQRHKRPDFDIVSMLLILLAICIVVGAVYFIFYFQESRVEELFGEEATVPMIVVENHGSETLAWYLSFYSPRTRKHALIVIPANTRLKVDYEDMPDYDIVENIHRRGGVRAVVKTVEQLTGDLFPFHLVYDLEYVERMVDLLEGLQLIVPREITHIDPGSDLFIQVPRGKHVLDGAKVGQLLLYRFGEQGLKSSIEHHRTVYASVLDRAEDLEGLFGRMKTSGILWDGLETNLSKRDLAALIREAGHMSSAGVLFYRMYGRDVTIQDRQVLTPVEDGAWLRDRIESVKKFLNDEGPAPLGDEIKIEILNGSTNPGQAQSLRNSFIEYGFNVVHFGNALRNDYEKTIVIDRIGRPSLAKRIADIIKCKEVYTRIDKDLMVDVTIILGNDFEGKYVR